MIAGVNSGHRVDSDFAEVSKIVKAGTTTMIEKEQLARLKKKAKEGNQ